MVSPEKHKEIVKHLYQLERQHDVRILYAVESGSRAWGFPSKDSDYDVRFIYVHRQDWYLSHRIENKPDNIQCELVGDIDCAGWDLKKTLGLFAKSNPPLYEWLDSPIVYIDNNFGSELRQFQPEFYSSIACAYHYFHMAKGNYNDYLTKEKVRLKKYFYVLRPIFAVLWIEQAKGMVPMAFSKLLEIVTDQELLSAINELIERKSSGEEIDSCDHIPVIKDYLTREVNRLDVQLKTMKPEPKKYDLERLDELFRDAIKYNGLFDFS